MNKLILAIALLSSVASAQTSGLLWPGSPALPNGTTATTQTTGDNTTKVATDAFVLANGGASGVQYNSALTIYGFYGDSKFIVSSSCIVGSSVGAITAWSITSNVVTFTVPNSQTAGNVLTLSGFGTSTFFNGQTVTVLSAGLSGTQFEANFTHANGSATEAGAFNCTYNWPSAFGRTAFANGHGTVIDWGIAGGTSANLVANYTATVHPSSPAVTGNPGFLFLHTGGNDFSSLTVGAVISNLQSVYASAHADGWTVVQMTDTLGQWNLVTQPSGPYYIAQLNLLIRGQGKSSTNAASGQYWDRLVDVAAVMNDPFDGNLYLQSGPDVGHFTDAGAAVAAGITNQAMAAQGTAVTTNAGQNIFTGNQTLQYNNPFLSIIDQVTGGQFTQGVHSTSGTPYVTIGGNIFNGGQFVYSLHSISGSTAITVPGTGMFCANAGGSGVFPISLPGDTGISRGAANEWDFGNCSAVGDKSATLKAANLVLTGTCTGCGSGSGTVTSFAAPSGSWPSWLVPTVATSTSTPSLSVAASAIPLASIAPLPLSCQPGMGDGLNAIPAGTYLQTTCRNETGLTWTLTAIRCVADAGSSTCNATNGAGTGLLTGAITGTSTYANGTQSGTTTIASGDFLKITFIADGTSKQIGIDVTGTY